MWPIGKLPQMIFGSQSFRCRPRNLRLGQGFNRYSCSYRSNSILSILNRKIRHNPNGGYVYINRGIYCFLERDLRELVFIQPEICAMAVIKE